MQKHVKKRNFKTIPVSASPNSFKINIGTMRIRKKMKSPSIEKEVNRTMSLGDRTIKDSINSNVSLAEVLC